MSAKSLPPGLNATECRTIKDSHREVERLGQVFALSFYKKLFEIAPGVRPMFNTDIETQSRKLLATLKKVVETIDHWDTIQPDIEALGRRHAYYGVRTEHYPIVGQALIFALGEMLGDQFKGEPEQAWLKLYGAIAKVMIAAAPTERASEVDTTRFFRSEG